MAVFACFVCDRQLLQDGSPGISIMNHIVGVGLVYVLEGQAVFVAPWLPVRPLDVGKNDEDNEVLANSEAVAAKSGGTDAEVFNTRHNV